MRKLVLATLVLTACAGGDDAADTTAVDTTAVAAPALTPAQTAFAGTWNGRSYRTGAPAADTGSKWVMTFTTSDAGLAGTLRFDGQTTDIPVRVDDMSDSTMRTTFGPYTSPTLGNAQVTTTTDGRIQGDSLFGTFVATPATGAAVNGRFSARKAQ